MLDAFIFKVSSELQRAGYVTDLQPRIPGVQALLYAHSPNRIRLGFAKVETHLLFVEWNHPAVGCLDELKALYRPFSELANQGFSTPHGLRLQIPNLALVAVSPAAFPADVLSFARTKDLTPWYGGETGQIILVNVGEKQVVSLRSLQFGRYPRHGAFALGHASHLVRQVCERAFP